MSLDTKKIRQDFPILKRKVNNKPLVYLDNAATSQKPGQVLEEIRYFYENHNANIHRGIHALSEEASQAYEEAREKVAEFIGSSRKELIFVRNATEAINLVALTWGLANLKKGDLVLLTEMEHHANIVPWQELSKSSGCRLEYIKVNQEFLLDWQDFQRKLKKKPKLVSLIHVSNVLGTINPVKKATKAAHKAGAKVLIDGAQSVPHMKVNTVKIGCDFFAFTGHKMLGPFGIGGLFVKREILEDMRPFLTGGGMVSKVAKNKTAFIEPPGRFEAGTPNIAGAIGLAQAVDYLEKIGMEKILKHEQKLTGYALKRLNELKEVIVYKPRDLQNQAGIISFNFKGVHAHDLAQILDQEGVAIRSGHHCAMILHKEVLKAGSTARASFSIYNDFNDIDRMIKALGKVKKVFS